LELYIPELDSKAYSTGIKNFYLKLYFGDAMIGSTYFYGGNEKLTWSNTMDFILDGSTNNIYIEIFEEYIGLELDQYVGSAHTHVTSFYENPI
jgi:hypothetical protein